MFFAAKFNNFCNKIVDWFVINFKKQQTKRIVRQWRRRRSSVYPQNNMLKRNSVDNGTKEKKVKTYNIEFGIFEQMGIEFIYGSNKSRKLRWFFIVLAMLFLVLFQCIDAVNRYLEWKVNTQITSETYQNRLSVCIVLQRKSSEEIGYWIQFNNSSFHSFDQHS